MFPLPQQLPLKRSIYPFIGPFWSHIDVSPNSDVGTGDVYYRSTTNMTLLIQAAQDINSAFNGANFMPDFLLIATWFKVGHFRGNTDKVGQIPTKLENFP